MRFRLGLLLLATAAFTPLKADLVVLDFEGFPDSTSLTTQCPGVTFSNATVLTAGISLNEFEFPPHSGTNVVFDDGGAMSITFANLILSFGGYFTYLEPLTLAGFDASDSEVASAVSAYSSNDALFGDPGSSPNEWITVAFTSGISSVTITGDQAGTSFVMDDATYTTSVPEPGILTLLAAECLGVIALLMAFKKKHQ